MNELAIVRMAWAGHLHDAANQLAQSGGLKTLAGRVLARYIVGLLVRQSRWQMRQYRYEESFDTLDDAGRIAGPLGKSLVIRQRQRLAESGEKIAESMFQAGDLSGCIRILESVSRRHFSSERTIQLLANSRIALEAEQNVKRGQYRRAIRQLESIADAVQNPAWIIKRIEWIRRHFDNAGKNETRRDMSDTVIIDEADKDHSPCSGSGEAGEKLFSIEIESQSHRWMLWIDGVGRFLICLEPEIWVGKYVPFSGIQVPVLGDLHRRHFRFSRRKDGSTLQAFSGLTVIERGENRDRQVGDRFRLNSGRSLTVDKAMHWLMTTDLGISWELRSLKREGENNFLFSPVSQHRTVPAADGVLWVEKSIRVGSSPANDIVTMSGQVDNDFLKLEFSETGVHLHSPSTVVTQRMTMMVSDSRPSMAWQIRTGTLAVVLEPLTVNQESPGFSCREAGST